MTKKLLYDSLRTTTRLAYVQSASPARYGYITRHSVVLPQKQRQSRATTAVMEGQSSNVPTKNALPRVN